MMRFLMFFLSLQNLRRDFQRFQTDEVPTKLQEKNRLIADFRAQEVK